MMELADDDDGTLWRLRRGFASLVLANPVLTNLMLVVVGLADLALVDAGMTNLVLDKTVKIDEYT